MHWGVVYDTIEVFIGKQSRRVNRFAIGLYYGLRFYGWSILYCIAFLTWNW
jgi:hypothetical protein